MYKLSVAAIFKNESHALQEWIEHYINHGVEHFYLINDNSSDNFLEIIQLYIDKKIVTLYNANFNYYKGRQMEMYNAFVMPVIKESNWLLVVDLDEFMWSPMYKDMTKMLDECSHFGQVQVNHTLFGSNGHINQPTSIVNSFTKRSKNLTTENPIGNSKYFINTNFDFRSLNVHHANFVVDEYHENVNVFILLGPEYFRLNHYSCQSFEFWKNIKCTRGDADCFFERKIKDFNNYDINEVDDFVLIEQNRL
jgi:hypothetical protein